MVFGGSLIVGSVPIGFLLASKYITEPHDGWWMWLTENAKENVDSEETVTVMDEWGGYGI